MGDVVHIDFRSRIKRHSENGVENPEAVFLEWLDHSPDYRALKAFAISVDTRNVMTVVAKIESDPESNSTDVLVKNLMAKKVNEYTAVEMLAIIKVLRGRFNVR